MENSPNHPLHHTHFHKKRAIFYRTYIFLNILAILSIFHYRFSFFFQQLKQTPLLTWIFLFSSEILLSIIWILKQPLNWKPISRTTFPDNLQNDENLPGIDVFICTCDPKKEPIFDVMNTVISAMSLNYPPEKLNVYLSDDGNSTLTLNGLKEAWGFATWWIPFCRRYNIKQVCPKAYFESYQEEIISNKNSFVHDRNIVEEKYENFKRRVHKLKVSDANRSTDDHPAIIQVINEQSVLRNEGPTINTEKTRIPFLVYVAREKRPSHPRHFKAGALNVLLRISSIMSNSPYILVLDCDMYCNDSTSPRNAMCFFVDPKISSSLAWVQFPQKFHNISESDIYDSQLRTFWNVQFLGLNGLQGPLLCGTNFYMNRKALCGFNADPYEGFDINEKSSFRSSNEFIKSFIQNGKCNGINSGESLSEYIKEAQFLASCNYEDDTQWGEKIGFRYHSVVEDAMTGFMLHSQGWKSIYLNPNRPQFLGTATTNLSDTLFQYSRWVVGLLQVGIAKYSLFYNTPTISLMQKMIYIWVLFSPLTFLPIYCLAIILPMCFFYGIPLYPKISDPIFVSYLIVFISSLLKHLIEVSLTRGSIHEFLNEQRTMMIKYITTCAYGSIECLMSILGIHEAIFTPTNKSGDEDKNKWYQIGKFDFRISNIFLVPIVTIVTLNLFGFVGGITRMIGNQEWDTLFGQVILSIYVIVLSFPVIEGMFLRKDEARVSFRAILISTLLSLVLLSLGYFITA